MQVKVREINLVPREYIQAQRFKHYKIIILLLLAIESLIFIGVAVILPMNQKEYEKTVFNELEYIKADPKYAVVTKKIEELNSAKQNLDHWSQKYTQLKQESLVGTELLDGLTARLPLGMTIDKLTISGNTQVGLSGESESKEQILSYLILLESTYRGAAVTFDIAEGESYTYNVTLDFPVPEPEAPAPEATASDVPPPEGQITMDEAMQPETGGAQ